MFPMPAMHRALEQAAERFGDRDAVLVGERRWSFAELDALANDFASRLAAEGVAAGERVAVMLTNRYEFVVVVNAVSKLGAASVLLSPAWKSVEIGHAVALTKPVHAVADGAAVGLLAEHLGVTDIDDVELTRS